MDRQSLRPLFLRAAALFLTLWCLMAGVLTYLNYQRHHEIIRSTIESAVLLSASRWASTDGWGDRWLSNFTGTLAPYGGAVTLRLYDDSGMETARSQLLAGTATTPLNGPLDIASYALLFDPGLTEEEQLQLAHRLREEPVFIDFSFDTWSEYCGYEYAEEDYTALFLQVSVEVTGVVDGDVLYPQKLVYHLPEEDVTLLDSSSGYWSGKTLTTLSFRFVSLSPALVGQSAPEVLLERQHMAQEHLNNTVTHYVGGKPQPVPLNGAVSSFTQAAGGDGWVGCSYWVSLSPTHGLWPVYLFTLLLAILLAFLIARAQAKRLRREQDLTNAVAHELKTPLAILHSYAEGLREDIAPDKRSQYLDVIMEQADQMAALVSALLDLSRMKAGKTAFAPAPVALDQIVASVFRALERPMETAGVTLALDLESCTVSGEEGRLSLVVSNLASNALKHTPAGGEIRVSLQIRGLFAHLLVENDGDPIPPEALPRLFEPFYRSDTARDRQSGGTGLGLALVKETVTLHGGTCGVENLPHGVRFWVELPLLEL